MRIQKSILSIVVLAVLALGCLGTAQADPVNVITGDLWRVPDGTAANAIPANVPATAPDVTFDVNSPLSFSGTPIQTFLNSGGAFNITENTPGTLTSLISDGITGTLIQFTGFVTVTNGQTFTVTHDDGLTLIIGGVDLGFNPGPTAPITTVATYSGPSGTFPFQLVYGECCRGSAVLQVDLPFSNVGGGAVPEPASLTLVGCGFLAMKGFAQRKRLKKK